MHVPITATPGVTGLFTDFIGGSDRIRSFYPHGYSVDAVADFARSHAELRAGTREQLAATLEAQQNRWGLDVLAVDKLRRGAVAVVTGQQAGLFTGPMYSVFKALTTVKLARELERRGIEAVPVFWIASDDHDHEEVEWAGILSKDSTLERVRTELSGGVRAPVGWLRLPPTIVDAIEECFRLLPPSEFHAAVRSLVAETYSAEVSPVDSFARMLGRLFEGTGLVLVDPLEPGMRALSRDALSKVADHVEGVRSAVLERNQELSAAGYRGQVQVDRDFTGLFVYRDRARESFVAGDETSDLSPNVLLRPLIQDSIFPTVAYVAGPAEVAYLAQAGAIYQYFGKAMPPVVPRITATLVEPPAARIMKKYALTIQDVFGGIDVLRGRVADLGSAAGIFDDVKGSIGAQIERLRPVLEGVDQTLGGALENSNQKIMHQLDSLHSRFVKGEARRNEVLDRQLATLINRLFPERKLQERLVNVTSFLVRYGLNLVPLIDAQLEMDGSIHQVVEL